MVKEAESDPGELSGGKEQGYEAPTVRLVGNVRNLVAGSGGAEEDSTTGQFDGPLGG